MLSGNKWYGQKVIADWRNTVFYFFSPYTFVKLRMQVALVNHTWKSQGEK